MLPAGDTCFIMSTTSYTASNCFMILLLYVPGEGTRYIPGWGGAARLLIP